MTTVDALRRRWLGAPERLGRALRDAAGEPGIPRATRRELERALARVEPAPRGRGTVPFVVVVPGGEDGAVLRVVATDLPRGDLTPLPPPRQDRVRAWLAATFPDLAFDGLRLHVTGPGPGPDTWQGTSWEAAAACAAVSVVLGIVPDPGVVVTGALGDTGALSAVAHLDAKRPIAADVGTLHHAEGPIAATLDRVLPGWAAARAQAASRGHAARARAAWGALQAGDHVGAAREAARATDAQDVATRARVAWVLGALALHGGDAEAGRAHLERAAALVPSWHDHPDDPPDDLCREEIAAYRAIALLDAGHAAEAHALGIATLATLDPPRPHRRHRWVRLQVAGSTHRAAIALDRLDEAERLLRDVVLGDAALVDQRARGLGDLAEVARRRGDAATASALLDAADEALAQADDARRTARFLALFRARLDAETGRAVPPPPPGGPLWPDLGLRFLATRHGAEDLRELLALPAVRGSLALRSVAAGEIAWHALHDGPGAALADRLADWIAPTGDPAVDALAPRLRQGPDADALRAVRRRTPYG